MRKLGETSFVTLDGVISGTNPSTARFPPRPFLAWMRLAWEQRLTALARATARSAHTNTARTHTQKQHNQSEGSDRP
jgi:hypothetical protein